MSDQQGNKSEEISERLTARIVRGEFEPGRKLQQDRVAREFGVSQVTAREALQSLASQGLAVRLPRRGMCVAPMDQGAVDELKVMRHALEPVALQYSVPNLTHRQIEHIERACAQCDAAETSLDWEEANQQFHMAVIAGCGMPRLIAEIRNLQTLYAWHFNSRYMTRWRRRDDPDHAAILSAVKDRDAARARSVMQRHLMRPA